MVLTKEFKSTIMARAKKDKKFCEAMLSEAVAELLTGDIDAGKAILRDSNGNLSRARKRALESPGRA